MAKSKEDIKYGTAQAKLSEDEVLRIRYKAGTPLEGGKIADSDPVDLFAGAHNISGEQRDVFSSARNLEKKPDEEQGSGDQSQLQR
ncbi:hypothetical protein ABFS83_08G161200 [Erythranthe nasuta]